MKKYIMSLDIGTTSCRTLIINKKGEIVSSHQLKLSILSPKSKWVEQDPIEIITVTKATINNALNKNHINPNEIAAIGITNQRETTIMWEKDTGLPIYNAIGWQDQRTTKFCEKLKKNINIDTLIKTKTGLNLNAYFSATKIQWILKHVPNATSLLHKNNLLFGTIDTWIIYNLTGKKVHVTDSTNASRTLLYNINTNDWDDELLNLFMIPRKILPTIKSSAEEYGIMSFYCINNEWIEAKTPIMAAVGDQQASLFGHLCFEPGEIKNTYGTGCFAMINIGKKPIFSQHGLLTTVALNYQGEITYALEGTVFVAGSALEWLHNNLNILYDNRLIDSYVKLIEQNDENLVYFVPAFSGFITPKLVPNARGAIYNIEWITKREHLIKAAVEAIAYQSYDIIKAMKKEVIDEIKTIKVDGGLLNCNYLMQFQANILNNRLYRAESSEITGLGAAYLAGLASGFWDSIASLKKLQKPAIVYDPNMTEERRSKLLKGWAAAVSKTIN